MIDLINTQIHLQIWICESQPSFADFFYIYTHVITHIQLRYSYATHTHTHTQLLRTNWPHITTVFHKSHLTNMSPSFVSHIILDFSVRYWRLTRYRRLTRWGTMAAINTANRSTDTAHCVSICRGDWQWSWAISNRAHWASHSLTQWFMWARTGLQYIIFLLDSKYKSPAVRLYYNTYLALCLKKIKGVCSPCDFCISLF